MEFKFTDFAKCSDAEYGLLKYHVDLSGNLHRSYELTDCRLPSGCEPSCVTLGFCKVSSKYLMYIRPETRYTGSSAVLASLFAPGPRSFTSFDSLAEHLRQTAEAAHTPYKITSSALFSRLRSELSHVVLGQPDAVDAAAFKIYGHVSKTKPSRPLSLIFYGPTGVGKSELGKAIPNVLRNIYPGENWQFVWTELNTFTEQHSVYRLTGAPPGYVGYDDTPIFESVSRNPNTVFMFDELEKAHPQVLKVFMSILDEGRCTAHKENAEGSRELDFRRCIFVFTTNSDLSANAGRPLGFAPQIDEGISPETQPDSNTDTSLAQRIFIADETARHAMVRSGVLKEIAGRFSGLIGFTALDDSAKRAVLKKQISALAGEYGLSVKSIADNVIDHLTVEGAFSVRSNTGILEGALTQLFSEYTLSHPYSSITITLSGDEICLTPAEKSVFIPVN